MSRLVTLIRLATIGLACTAAFAQITKLSFRPIKAEYHKTLDRLILISSVPNVLHIYNPVSKRDIQVRLPKPPLSLSLSPNGRFAAVGHDKLISWVNLTTATVQKTFKIPVTANSVVLSDNWAYVIPIYWGTSVSVNLPSGEVISNELFPYGSGPRLHPVLNAIYATHDRGLVQYDISTGAISSYQQHSYDRICVGESLWFSPDAGRIYTGCGTVFHASRDPDRDMSYLSSFRGIQSVGTLDESVERKTVALVQAPKLYGAEDDAVLLFESSYLQPAARYALPPFVARETSYQAHGKSVFFNATSTALYVLMQADPQAKLANDFALYSIPVNSSAPTCGAVFDTFSANIPAEGAQSTVGIKAASTCIYKATSSPSWIQIVAGGQGAGDGTLSYYVRANRSRTARTGSISLGSRAFTIRQEGASSPEPLARLGYKVVDADYARQRDKLVLITTDPNELHLINPIDRSEQAVPLMLPPLSLSISPDGAFAAVGHDGWVSYVNLSTAKVQKAFTVPVSATAVVLSDAWIYVVPIHSDYAFSVRLAAGEVTEARLLDGATGVRLNTGVNAIYGTRDLVSPNDIEKLHISTGPITGAMDSSYHGGYCIFGPVWFSPDGGRVYTGCGTIFRASRDPQLDMRYLSSIPGFGSIASLDESAAIQKIALIPKDGIYPDPELKDNRVLLFESSYLKPAGQFLLPPFVVTGAEFKAHGKKVFFNAASNALYVLAQADETARLSNDFAFYRLPLSSAPSACGAVFQAATATVPATGSLGAIGITAGPTCTYQATTSTPWIQLVSGAYGSGNGTLTYIARPNLAKSARTGLISMGAQRLTIQQEGATSPGPVARLGYNVAGAAYDKSADRFILVTANPNELHIYSPANAADQTVPLAFPPLSLSVRPDGAFAAVGHDGWVSYVNLGTGAVQKVFQVVSDVGGIVLASNGYMYLFTRNESDVFSLEIASGSLTRSPGEYGTQGARLHAGGKYIYAGGYLSAKYDLSQGVVEQIYAHSMETCDNLWLASDGLRAYTACAMAYTTSENPEQDCQFVGTFSSAPAVVWADQSAQQQATAIIPGLLYNTPVTEDTVVQVYNDASLAFKAAVPLPQFTVSGTPFTSHGKFVFWNQAGTALYALVQADSTAQLLSNWAIVKLSPPSAVAAK